MVNIISNSLILHFGEIFMKIQSKKIPKLQMHEKFSKIVNTVNLVLVRTLE